MEANRIDTSQENFLSEENLRRQIEVRAYEIYLSRGCADGNSQQDWLQAEDEIIAGIVAQDTVSQMLSQSKAASPPLAKAAQKSAGRR